MSTIAQRLLNLYNNMVIANSVTNEFTQALPDCYDAVEEKGGTLPAQQTAANLPAAISSIPAAVASDVVFVSGETPSNCFAVNNVKSVTSNITTLAPCAFLGCTNLEYASFNNVTSIEYNSGTNYTAQNFYGCSNAEIHLEGLTRLVGYNTFYNCVADKIHLDSLTFAQGAGSTWANSPFRNVTGNTLNLPNLTQFNAYCMVGLHCKELLMPKLTTANQATVFYDSATLERIHLVFCGAFGSSNTSFNVLVNLIDIEFASGMASDISLNYWNPTNVIADSTKLATLNANIRDHIAAKVANGNNSLTFTVSSNLYNNLEQATLDAFSAKGWAVAGA